MLAAPVPGSPPDEADDASPAGAEQEPLLDGPDMETCCEDLLQQHADQARQLPAHAPVLPPELCSRVLSAFWAAWEVRPAAWCSL